MSSMEVCNVREVGTVRSSATKKNFLGEEINVVEGERIYFVNTMFSNSGYGFLINKDGVILGQTAEFNMSSDEVHRYAARAKDMIAQGRLNDLNLRIQL